MALLCLYQRKGQPVLDDLRVPPEPGAQARAMRLAALLHLAEYLDRSCAQSITRLRLVENGGKQLRLQARVRPGADGRVEIWKAQRNADLFERAFECKLDLVPA